MLGNNYRKIHIGRAEYSIIVKQTEIILLENKE